VCNTEKIELKGLTEKYLERRDCGILAVTIDVIYMMMFMGTIWVMLYFIKVDSTRHKNLLFET